jgi:hypothetical protein
MGNSLVKQRYFKIAVLVAAVLLIAQATRADVTLFDKGKPAASIVILGPLDNAPEAQRLKQGELNVSRKLIVDEINDHFFKTFGQRLPVVVLDKPAAFPGPAIILGELAGADAPAEKTSVGKEGFRVKVAGNHVLISGESDQATLFGAYFFLRKLGYEWVMPGDIGTVLPKLGPDKTLVAKDSDDSKAPDFYIRRIFYTGIKKDANILGPQHAQWLMRQYGAFNDHPAADTAGHAWGNLIAKHKELFAKNPEMLALVRQADGTLKRSGPQIESTNPQVIKLIEDDIKALYAKNNWPKDKHVGVPIGPADGLGYSESTESKLAGTSRIDPNAGEQDQTDLVILLANTVLKNLEKEYPNLYLGYYVYSTHADYPARYTPHPHVCPIFAPINYSRFHGVGDPISKTWPAYADVVEQWAKLSIKQGNPLLYRGYTWNIADDVLPFIKCHVWGTEIPYYRKLNFIGASVQGVKAWGIQGPSDYVLMQMLFDSSQDWHKLLANYCEKSYGEGAQAMLAYYDRLTARLRDSGIESGSYHAYSLIFDQAYMKQAQADLDQATQAAQTPEEKTRIKYVAYSHQMLGIFLEFDAAIKNFDYTRARFLYEALQAHWQKQYDDNPNLSCELGRSYLKRYLDRYSAEALKFSSGEYKIVYRIPDELPTLFDPTVSGHQNHYYAPELVDKNFLKTKTYSSTWDAQGLGPIKKGAVWYRVRFTLPADAGKEPIGLFLGSFEDEARVYLNEQFLGTSGRRFSIPAQFDLTGAIKRTGENVLAIQTVKNLNINELGLGGLFRPSYIFAGPRLAQVAPKQIDLGRALPGGGEVKAGE